MHSISLYLLKTSVCFQLLKVMRRSFLIDTTDTMRKHGQIVVRCLEDVNITVPLVYEFVLYYLCILPGIVVKTNSSFMHSYHINNLNAYKNIFN